MKIALALVSLLCASGCMIGHYEEGLPVSTEKIPSIVVGKTTKAEILDWFGAPSGMADGQMLEAFLADRELTPGPVVDLPFADVLVFRMTHGRVKGLILIVWNWLEVRVTNDTLVVFFDANDRVSSYAFRRGSNELE